MEHISTLCAISTVGIAATGFALGRVDRDSPKPARFRKKTLPLQDQRARAREPPRSPLDGDVQSGSSTPFSTVDNKSTTQFKAFHVGGDDSTAGNHPKYPNHRRRSSLAGIILRRRGQTLSNPPLRVEEDPSVLHNRRPSSSWVRRLSFQPGNRSSCQSPTSPTSNRPTSPTHSHPFSQRRAPNKLVKRPPSQSSSAHYQFAHVPLSPSTALFRRPATSHQRPEHVRHKATHSLSFEPSLLTNTLLLPTNRESSVDDIPWQPYLTATYDGIPDKLARRLSTVTKPKEYGLRRILPSTDTIPALLLANSITNKESSTAVGSPETAPTSPVQFRDPFKSNDISRELKISLVPEENGPQLSISASDDPKSAIPAPDNTDIHKPLSTALTRPKMRAISAPLPTFSNPEGAVLLSSRSRARRNITDPSIFRRPPAASRADGFIGSGFMSPGWKKVASSSRIDFSYLRETGQRPLTSDGVALSVLHNPIRQRPKRHSIAASDPASTVIGSDDTRIFTSGEEDETDFLSDTAFDSIRTHITTSSNSGLHSPRIETIFDSDLPLSDAGEGSLRVKQFTSHYTFASQPFGDGNSHPNLMLTPVPVSLPDPQENHMHEEEESRISFPSDLADDEDAHSLVAALPGEIVKFGEHSKHPDISLNNYERTCTGHDILFAHGRPDTPLDLTRSNSHGVTNEMFEFCPRMNIFDWSEQPRNDREISGPDGRPRTVHGKHGPELRGSRAPGRKAPNTLHLRSQSVPVSREHPATNETRQTSGKFGTWGLGSKGVSEDWDSDFDFEDADESAISESMQTSKNIARRSMIVPQAIMERQASLHGQFGQVQELTLLVEELKRLRHQASFLDIVRGPSNELWKEAEGIVNLATLDDEENNHSPPGSPSSLTFSFDDSEEESANTDDPSKRASGEFWRASFSEPSGPNQTTADSDHKESPAKTSSVLDLIYQQRISRDSSFVNPQPPRSKKLPFDTQSLRDLVIRAGVVTRALKEVIRRAEGVASESDENMHHSVPPFSRIFSQSSDGDLSTFETHCIA
ncbi:hypothetical protein BDV26DRAFT_233459 [Aspergillus bertholletiae]|uniref:Uncharacterized protein n=1 Tax=Aspergillus bertholletiae TaxID=1226010 RepID=A0A5N7B381_9EURO|nr:hypothetical protein BDV26DRAFT_233459 [Aspergillus bertholletiae]